MEQAYCECEDLAIVQFRDLFFAVSTSIVRKLCRNLNKSWDFKIFLVSSLLKYLLHFRWNTLHGLEANTAQKRSRKGSIHRQRQEQLIPLFKQYPTDTNSQFMRMPCFAHFRHRSTPSVIM